MSTISFLIQLFTFLNLYPSINSKFLETRLFLMDCLPAASNFSIYSYFNQNFIIHQIYLILQNYKTTWIFLRKKREGGSEITEKNHIRAPTEQKTDKTEHLSVLLTVNHKRNIQPLGLPTVPSLPLHSFSHVAERQQTSIRGKPAKDNWKKMHQKRRDETEGMDGVYGIRLESLRATGGSGGHSYYSTVFLFPAFISFILPISLFPKPEHHL